MRPTTTRTGGRTQEDALNGKVIRSAVTVPVVVAVAVGLVLSWTMTTAVGLTATTALLMGGTGMPSPGAGYRQGLTDKYIDPHFATDIPDADQFTVATPEQLFPLVGQMTFDDSVAQGVNALEVALQVHQGDRIIVLGYSHSTRIETVAKRRIIAAAEAAGGEFADYPDISFVMLSNINKPNGGVLSRLQPLGGFPFIGFSYDGPTPTTSPENPAVEGDYALDTADYSYVHDGFSDYPAYPLNLLALFNAYLGILFLHGQYPSLAGTVSTNPDVFFQGSHGDTDYYVIGTDIVPILRPLLLVPRPILLFLDEPIRVLIEAGYEREISPGQQVTLGLLPQKDPFTLLTNFVTAFAVGFDDAMQDLGAGRPLSTTPSGPFGVGGPTRPIPDPTQPVVQSAAAVRVDPAPHFAQPEPGSTVEKSSTPTAEGEPAAITAESEPEITTHAAITLAEVDPDGTRIDIHEDASATHEVVQRDSPRATPGQLPRAVDPEGVDLTSAAGSPATVAESGGERTNLPGVEPATTGLPSAASAAA